MQERRQLLPLQSKENLLLRRTRDSAGIKNRSAPETTKKKRVLSPANRGKTPGVDLNQRPSSATGLQQQLRFEGASLGTPGWIGVEQRRRKKMRKRGGCKSSD